MISRMIVLSLTVLLVLSVGCSGKQKIIDAQLQEIDALQGKLNGMEAKWVAEKGRADRLTAELNQALGEFTEEKDVLLDQIATKSIVTVSDAALFQSGGTSLTSAGREILGRIGEVVDMYPDREILVEGHTDNIQIAPQFQQNFKSNWELSSARANSALHYMRENYNVPPHRMASVGYGEHRPAADNTTPEGRAMNRRVVIVIGPVMEEMQVTAGDAPYPPLP